MKKNLYTCIASGLLIGSYATLCAQEPRFRVTDSKGNTLNFDAQVVKETETVKQITPSQKRRLEEVGRAARDLVRPENLTPRA